MHRGSKIVNTVLDNKILENFIVMGSWENDYTKINENRVIVKIG